MVLVWKRRDREVRRNLAATEDASGQDFSRVRLMALDLHSKVLRGCNFEYADLTEANLEHSDLRGANLRGAYLTGARFASSNLTEACLDEAMMMATDFRDAVFTKVSLNGAIWDQSTFWPAGFHPKMGDVGRWHGRQRPAT